jgi:hypothetical protein
MRPLRWITEQAREKVVIRKNQPPPAGRGLADIKKTGPYCAARFAL